MPIQTQNHELPECFRIKGHQHFSGNSHKKEPGKYWNWFHYYSLLNHDNIDSKSFNSTQGEYTVRQGEDYFLLDNRRIRYTLK